MRLFQQMLFITSIFLSSFSAFAFNHSHEKFSQILKEHTEQKNGQTWVNYKELKSKAGTALADYLKSLSGVSTKEYSGFSADEKLSFLINAYNAFTIEWILRHYPIDSIKDTGSFITSPWKKTFPQYQLLGSDFTLDSIEHERIRKEFNEPRIHFAVNCASIGCPSLRPSAYTAGHLKKELSEAEEQFFKNPGKFIVKDQVAYVSPILDWYGSDFEKVFGSVRSYLHERSLHYGVAKNLKDKEKFKIKYLDYNWDLNGR